MKTRMMCIAVLLCGCVIGGGCMPQMPSPGAESRAPAQPAMPAEQVRQIAEAVASAVGRVDPVVEAAEQVAGQRLSADTVARGESVAGKVGSVAEQAGRIAGIAAAIPGPQQPYAVGLATILGGLGTLAGSIAAFFQRRKAATAQRATDAVIKGANGLPGAGKSITEAAKQAGVADYVESRYREVAA